MNEHTQQTNTRRGLTVEWMGRSRAAKSEKKKSHNRRINNDFSRVFSQPATFHQGRRAT